MIRRAIREERQDVYEVITTSKEIQNDEIVEVESVGMTTTIQQRIEDNANLMNQIEQLQQGIVKNNLIIQEIESYKLTSPEK